MAALNIIIKLESSAGTGYFVTTTKNSRKPEKISLMKYDPVIRKRVLFNEKKVK